ncbi:MAG: thymidine phosphorylase [Alphaproteobacteria bacterium]
MNLAEIIRAKRDGGALPRADIDAMVTAITDESASEGQVAAFAMAVFLRGMATDETVALTEAMMRSGSKLDWPGERPVVDKHSTGGVGDKVSLMLAPMVAACGGAVPMISGRGLGHTGGTLDKLESIPGYDATPGLDRFKEVVGDAGCAIIGQTADLAPADRRLYAIRDVTATVESIPLITASILSKKLAAGLDALVMDVKTGTGAFAASLDMALDLARSIVSVANGAGVNTAALITDMNQVLGATAGNAVEVRETVNYLTGARRDERLHDVVMALAARLLRLGGLATDDGDARAQLQAALDDGRATERFQRMVAALGGPADFVERHDSYLAQAPVTRPVPAPTSGAVAAMDARAVGLAVVMLGGGRQRPSDAVDHRVGLTDVVGLGTELSAGDPLALVHAADDAAASAASAAIQGAVEIGDAPAARSAVIELIE